MKLSINTKGLNEAKGIVYVLIIKLEDKELIKIGVTAGKVEDRVVSVLKSIWSRYRVFPECVVKRYRTCDSMFKIEKELHKLFADNRYTTQHVFSGSTEMFDADLTNVLNAYDTRMIKNEPTSKE